MAPRYGQSDAVYLRDTVTLPAKLLSAIPRCAQDCAISRVGLEFPSSECGKSDVSACLCSHYSTSGFTLGELALGCVIENCSSTTAGAVKLQVFNICSGSASTVSPTHPVLTLTQLGGASTISRSITSASSSQITQTAVASIRPDTPTVPTSTTLTNASTSSAPISAAESLHSAAATSSESPKALTTGQTVGISVASIAIAALLFGLCFFCCCCVRRRKKEEKNKKAGSPTRKWFKSSHRLDFQDQASPTGSRFPSKSTTRPATSSPKGPVRPPRSFPASPNRSPRSSLSSFSKSPEVITQRRFRPSFRPQQEWWRETSRPDIRQVPDGLKSHRASISSLNRSETRSPRLLTPIANITINLKTASKHLRPDSAATRWTMFEEDSKSPMNKDVLPEPPAMPKASFPSSNCLPPGPSFTYQYTTSPEDMTRSGLMLQIQRKPLKSNEASVLNGISLNTGISRMDHLSMPPSSAASYLPAYYTSSDSRTPVAPKWSPSDHERFSHPGFAPLPLMPRGVRSSWASATTFESVDPDETTPENEVDKQLSPVSYPKVPRPSNQAIPRSPPSTTSSRKVTLAAKRRGEDLSLNLGGGLMITNIRGVPESPLQHYGNRTKRGTNNTPQMQLKSPLWEPKLTPSRRGDDLYLSVEVRGH
ncbi:hypothetical protein AUEXF2481DRAFT_5998 [Aureobasidium subglaciale EXF-2481]|uniref:CFEM domain-containing protein n=1 Tax=Aureobasidium subglaciale (strain EXF-2481) TaxID=1043005 RepID=A0A074YKA7_AURSE|nr:uncharacterized protein AUEXF2481DRAFT_5998 [Aureobasidium subglaciale EXF-2481]KEQ94517.1 hypothetical protein AUEXF2481DRAFT_5998 [Aureobasidium subglaciale EXF-2481]